MSGPDSMADSDFIEVGGPLPRIRKAIYLRDMSVQIEWDDGRESVVDLTPAMMSHRHFVPLRGDLETFSKFVVRERGDALVWPDGQELSASWIDELVTETLDNAQFRQAMADLRLSLDGMAARLGVARRLIADYRKDKPIPQVISLATRYLVEQQKKAG